MSMRARVFVRLKRGILDPQGMTVKRALEGLGYHEVQELRVGRLLELDLADLDPRTARERLEDMCQRLLANPVTEDFTVEIVEEKRPTRLPEGARGV